MPQQMTIADALTSLDELGKSLFDSYFQQEMAWGGPPVEMGEPRDEEPEGERREKAAQRAINRLLEHYTYTPEGGWKIRAGHRYVPEVGRWDYEISEETVVSFSRPQVFFDGEQVSTLDFAYPSGQAWHPIVSVGTWQHPVHGQTTFTHKDLEEYRDNFASGVLGQQVPIDQLEGHRVSTEGAYGWVEDVQLVGDQLLGKISYTDLGREAVENGRYKYISPSLCTSRRPFSDPQTGEKRNNVLVGVALTNHPVLTGQPDLTVDLSQYQLQSDPAPSTEGDQGVTEEVTSMADIPQVEDVVVPEQDAGTEDMAMPPTTVQTEDYARQIAALEARIGEQEAEIRRRDLMARFGAMEFSRETGTGHYAPAAVSLITETAMALEGHEDLAEKFSRMVEAGGFDVVVREPIGMEFGRKPEGDEVEQFGYAADTTEAIRTYMVEHNVSATQARDYVLSRRMPGRNH